MPADVQGHVDIDFVFAQFLFHGRPVECNGAAVFRHCDICKTDGNANVTSTTTFAENLRELAEWRDRHAPGMPIWMTETGYDSAGPFGTTEAIQAARLPRVVMLCLANGVEKVFVYRESGSTPS